MAPLAQLDHQRPAGALRVGTAAITVLGKLGATAGLEHRWGLAVGSAAATRLEKLLKPLQSNLHRRQQEQSKRERELSSLLTGGRLQGL